MYLCLVIKEAYSLSFFTSSTLACTAWLDVKYSSRQQFVRFTASWRRSFLQHNTLRLPHLNIIREKFFNIRKTISLKTFIYVFQSVLCFFKWNLENNCWIFPSRNTFKWKFGRTWKSSRTCLVLHWCFTAFPILTYLHWCFCNWIEAQKLCFTSFIQCVQLYIYQGDQSTGSSFWILFDKYDTSSARIQNTYHWEMYSSCKYCKEFNIVGTRISL